MRFATVSLALLLLACSTRRRTDGASSEPQFGTQEEAGGDAVIATLERTACYGICPAYKLSIRADRKVQYEGASFVKVKGRAEWQLSPEDATRLRQAFDKVKFFSFRDSYEERNVTDGATTIVSRIEQGTRKTVRHYQGDRSAPSDLQWIENEIDSIVHIANWIGTDQERLQNIATWR